ncbi:hypothetical protein AMTRI_Chr08g164690 [Amborella trichopoda]
MEEGEHQDGGCGWLAVDCGVGEMKIAEVVELLPGAWERETRGTGKEEGLVAMVKEEEMAATQVVIAGNGS